MKNERNCVFCDREKIQQDIIYETPNLMIKVGFSLFAPGQTMLLSKEHYSCFAAIPDTLDQEYNDVKNSLTRRVAETFSEPFLIEMGVWGQSVSHAHTHVIPHKSPDYEIKSILEEMVLPGNIDLEEADMKRLKEVYKQERGYVSIEEHGRLYICHVTGIEFNPANFHPNLTFRGFCKQRGLDAGTSWKSLSEEQKKRDNERRDITKKLLIFP